MLEKATATHSSILSQGILWTEEPGGLQSMGVSWNSNPLATWCKELTHLKTSDAGKDWRQEEKGTTEDEMVGWHYWLSGHGVSSGRWWWTGRPGVLQSVGLQRVRHCWATELNWTEYGLDPHTKRTDHREDGEVGKFIHPNKATEGLGKEKVWPMSSPWEA